jgi:hypothetical protein
MPDLGKQQIDTWRSFVVRMEADDVWMRERGASRDERPGAAKEIREHMDGFLSGKLSVEQVRKAFDTKGRKQWSCYGLGGMSFAMFLNMLVKNVPNRKELSAELSKAVRAPDGNATARGQSQAFAAYLERLIAEKAVTRQQVQPARAPMFLSAWWYFQESERWPIYYLSARQALEKKGLIDPKGDPVEDYLGFCDCYIALALALGVTFEELEAVCMWVSEREGKDVEVQPPAPPDVSSSGTVHTQTQWVLANLGNHFGCGVWIAKNDRTKAWQGEVLGELAVDQLPNLGIGREAQDVVSLIDVVWFRRKGQVVAAFEIETTTSVHSGILRMSDLSVMVPNIVFPLYIVAPAERAEKVERELRRATFQTLELHKRCRYIRCEDLIVSAENIKRFGADPSAVDRLAVQVKDVNS